MFIMALNETLVSLKNRSRSPKSYHFLKAITMLYLCQFGSEYKAITMLYLCQFGSEYCIQVRFFHGCMTLIMTLVSGVLKKSVKNT